jgi:hypothetical protein
MERAAVRWSLQDRQYPSRDFHTPASLLDGWTTTTEMIRCKARRKNNVAAIGRAKTFANQDAKLARFDLQSNHFLSVDSSASNSLLPSQYAVIPSEARNLCSTLALAETPPRSFFRSTEKSLSKRKDAELWLSLSTRRVRR